MIILQAEHRVPDFAEWKKLFDSDPADRAGSGVKKHRVSQHADDPNLVLIELSFDNRDTAEAMLEKLRGIWSSMPDNMRFDPETRFIEVVDESEY